MEKVENTELSKRQVKEILFLLNSSGDKLTEGKIAKNFGITRKTVRKDIVNIKTFLNSKGIDLKIKPKKGITLRGISKKKKQSIKFELKERLGSERKFSKVERFSLILAHCLLTTKIPTIEDWSELLNVSRITVMKDILKVKKWLRGENLELVGKPGVGFKLIGEEKNIRDAIVDFFMLILFQHEEYIDLWRENISLPDVLNGFHLEILSDIYSFEIRNFVQRVEKALGTTLLYEDYIKFLMYISVSLRRIREGYHIKALPQEISNTVKKPQYKLIKENVNHLCDVSEIKIDQGEIVYLTERLATLRFHSEPHIFSIYEKSTDIYARHLAKLAEGIFGLPFTKDEEFIQLVSAHLRMFFGKIDYGIKVMNPFFDEIKNNCPLLLKVSERICKQCAQKFHIKLLNQEAQCIALYLLEEIEKMSWRRRKRIAVLCPQSMAITHFLKWKLKNSIPEVDVTIVRSCGDDQKDNKFLSNVDLILSTEPIPLIKIPTLIIPRFLSDEYIEKIKEILHIKYRGSDEYNEKFLYKNKGFVSLLELKLSEGENLSVKLAEELHKRGYIRDNSFKELSKAGINNSSKSHNFAFSYTSAKIGIKSGIVVIPLNKINSNYLTTYRLSSNKKFLIIPIFANNPDENLKVLKGFRYLVRKAGLNLEKFTITFS